MMLSVIDLNHVLHYIHKNVDIFRTRISTTHVYKLFNLGAFYNPPHVNVNQVIHNLSRRSFSNREKWLLSFGLDHCFPRKLSFFDLKLQFELLLERLLKQPITQKYTFDNLTNDLKTLNNDIFRKYRTTVDVRNSLFKVSDFEILKRLKQDKSIVICKPDKGRGIVILNRDDYI